MLVGLECDQRSHDARCLRRLSPELDPMGIVNEAVQDRVGERWDRRSCRASD